MLNDKTTTAYVGKFVSSLSTLDSSSANEPLDQEQQHVLLSQMATRNDAETGSKKRAPSTRKTKAQAGAKGRRGRKIEDEDDEEEEEEEESGEENSEDED